nr:hypothetical protein [Tanacetum cinerariifolium]
MRINLGMKPQEPTYQVVLDALALTTCYPAFLVTAEVPIVYMHQFWATVMKHMSSYRFKIDNKKFYVNVKVFRDILNICLRIQGQEFDEPQLKRKLYLLSSSIPMGNVLQEESGLCCFNLGAEPPRSRKSKKKSNSAISSEESPSKKKFAKAKNIAAAKHKTNKKKAPGKADKGKGLNVLSGEANDDDEKDSEDENDYNGNDDDDGNDSDGDDDDDANDDDTYDDDEETNNDRTESKRIKIHVLNQSSIEYCEEEEEKINDKETMDEEKDDEVTKELYNDVNVNLGNREADMTNVDQGGTD